MTNSRRCLYALSYLLLTLAPLPISTAFSPLGRSLPLRHLGTRYIKTGLSPIERCPPHRRPESPLHRRNMQGWDGDDTRYWSKIRRRILRGQMDGSNTPAIASLILINFLMFLYQTSNTVNRIRKRNPNYWPSDALSMITDTLLGTTNVRGSLTTDFIFSGFLAKRQPHRYLTAGFLHGDIIHLLLNLSAFRSLPPWLETGLGAPIFLTTFLVSIVTGNINYAFYSSQTVATSFCLGASGGICGLYGLMYVALVKMGNSQSAMRVIKGMLLLLVSGLLLDNVSNAGHIGGFLGGIVMGILFAPNYKKSYSMNRKWSLDVDSWPRDYRQMMGFGISPSRRGLFPISALWAVAAVFLVAEPRFRSIPYCIVRGLVKPGSVSRF